MTGPKLTEEDLRQWKAEGLSDAKVAERAGCSSVWVKMFRRSLGIPGLPKGKATDEEIIRLHGEGMTPTGMAYRLGMTRPCVLARLRELNLPVDGRVARRKVDVDRLRELHAEGLNDREISKRMDVSADTIRAWRGRLGLPTIVKKNEVLDRDIRRLHAEGLGTSKIAAATGVSATTVGAHLSAMGLVGNPVPGRKGSISPDEVKRLHAEGLNDSEISRRLGVSNSSVAHRRKKLGLPMNVKGCPPAPAPNASPIPASEAKRIAEAYGWSRVVVHAFLDGNPRGECVVDFGFPGDSPRSL